MEEYLTVVALPMLPLGAPIGVVTLRNLDPAAPVAEVRNHLVRHLEKTHIGPRAHVFLYRADLRLDMFPGRTSWRFMSTVPLSQVFNILAYPAPWSSQSSARLVDFLANSPDTRTPQDPPRTVHLIAEIVEGAGQLGERYSGHRRLLRDAHPKTFARLSNFLRTPPEPLATSSTKPSMTLADPTTVPSLLSYPQTPCYLAKVPAVARLTLPEHKIMVRPVFVKLLDQILRELPDKTRSVYVTATTGAGKSAFLWFVLHTLCRRGRTRCGKHVAPPMDLVLDVPGLLVLIDTAGEIFTGPRRERFRVELMKKETLYLVDFAHGSHRELRHNPPYFASHDVADNRRTFRGHASRILVALPRDHILRVSRNTNSVMKLLPRWKPWELELCRRACFPALDSALLTARIKYWGHQPQWTLAQDPAQGVGKQRFVEMLRDPA